MFISSLFYESMEVHRDTIRTNSAACLHCLFAVDYDIRMYEESIRVKTSTVANVHGGYVDRLARYWREHKIDVYMCVTLLATKLQLHLTRYFILALKCFSLVKHFCFFCLN